MKLRITVDNKTYEVEVEAVDPDPTPTIGRPYAVEPAAIRASAPVPTAVTTGAVANEEKVCRSPIAGIVVKVAAQAGQSIQAGDILLVLEAMKMETNITAPIGGKVAKLNVGVGDSVKGGQVVVEFE